MIRSAAHPAGRIHLRAPSRRRIGAIGVAALATAAGVAANRYVAKRSERSHPPAGKFVEVDGVRLHYLEQGRGRPVVLLHGDGSLAQDFVISGLFGDLAEQYRTISFDRPGFGYSERPRSRAWSAERQADVVMAAIEMLGLERPIIVAHSWGTLVALNMALKQPAAVAGLVLMSGYYNPTPRPELPLMSTPALPVLGALLRYTVSPILGWALTPLAYRALFAPARTPARFKDAFPISLTLRPSQIRANAADAARLLPNAARTIDRRRSLSVPLLVIGGVQDRLVSFEHQSKALAKELPQSTLLGVEGAGHMVHHTAPTQVRQAIVSFAERLAA